MPSTLLNLFILLPTYNEEANLPELLNHFIKATTSGLIPKETRIILVDDGSNDATYSIAVSYQKKMNLVIVKHENNMGLGAALRTGLKKLCETVKSDQLTRDTVALVTMDSDYSHSPDLIKDMIDKLKDGVQVVIASRYAQGAQEVGLSKLRSALSRGCNKICSLFFPIQNVKDYSSGYRLIRFDPIESLAQETNNHFFKENGFVCMSEFLINLSRSGALFAEVPLVLRYDLKKGKSKMKIFKTIFQYALLILRK